MGSDDMSDEQPNTTGAQDEAEIEADGESAVWDPQLDQLGAAQGAGGEGAEKGGGEAHASLEASHSLSSSVNGHRARRASTPPPETPSQMRSRFTVPAGRNTGSRALAPGTVVTRQESDPDFDARSGFTEYGSGLGRGVLYWLSTKCGAEPFLNPLHTGAIRVEAGPAAWSTSMMDLLGNRPRHSCSRGVEGSWFSVELQFFFTPTHYSLRHGWASADGALRSWEFASSVDGDEWQAVRVHHDDHSLGGRFATHTWSLAGALPATKFRVRMLGPHWGGRHFLYCSGFEMYGKCGDSHFFAGN